VIFISCSFAEEKVLPNSKLTILVHDEENNLLSGANVYLGYAIPKSDGWGIKIKPIIGVTTDAGVFTYESQSFQNLTYGAYKDGYEKVMLKYMFKSKGDDGQWLPWNPTLNVIIKRAK